MAKNITILEGRETRTFGGVEKLQTNLAGGGTQNWIPEDEAADYVDAEDLEVDENGYYAPDPGSFFSSVDVNVEVEPDLEEITITENGIYTPQGDGFSSVSVEVDTSGGGDDPSVHGNEVTAIAQTDLTAGETVAVQSDSDEPIGVSCPMEGRGATSNPSAFDGKNLYWVSGSFSASEVRKKPIANIEADRYTTVLSKVSGSAYYMPWAYDWRLAQEEVVEGERKEKAGSIFTSRLIDMAYTGKSITNWGRFFTGTDGKLYDTHLKCVNDNGPSMQYGMHGFCISSSRYVRHQGAYGYRGDFQVAVIGSSVFDTYTFDPPEGYESAQGSALQMSQMMPCGNHVVFVIQDGVDPTKHCLFSIEFDAEGEYEGNTHEVEGTVLYEWHYTNGTVGHDTLYDTWAIATDNGLVVLNSDLSYKHYEKLKSNATPFLALQYVWLAGSCYKLIDDEALMIATSAKGTEGMLGVCKNNVKAGEEGTAIILFS